MRKAGIVTLFGEFNFGNRLQNYAVQEILKKYELNVETIKYIGLDDDVPSVENDREKRRLANFKNFNQNIVFSEQTLYKEYDAPDKFEENYDFIVMGSDQIWNFTFDKVFSDKALGSFAPKHKKISLAASFGIDIIPEENSETYNILKKYLDDIKVISVRESAGKEIIKKITNRDDVEVLIDPTMMIENEKWEKIMKKPSNLKSDKYILKSFLGQVSEEAWQEITRVAKENECEIIDISDESSPYYDVGPAEFLYLEKNAFLVVTDSFHSCVFSILFSTPFVVFERIDNNLKNMYSRIETLLHKFEIEDRKFDKKITPSILCNNYSKAHSILVNERIKVTNFLDSALK